MNKSVKYQVRHGDGWQTCLRGAVQPSGWLHYELRDGTNGLCRPGQWREKPEDVKTD